MKSLKVFPTETKVRLIPSGLEGVITSIIIKGRNVDYVVEVFNNGKLDDYYRSEAQFEVIEGKKQTIGFFNPDHDKTKKV